MLLFIALTPERNQISTIAVLRPISLTSSLYKVIAKVALEAWLKWWRDGEGLWEVLRFKSQWGQKVIYHKKNKVIAKFFHITFVKFLHETIYWSQGAFVEGRQILDVFLVANEVVDQRRRFGKSRIVFNIDFDKAYGHMNWDFLDHASERKDFSPKWRLWICGCLSSISFAILVNAVSKVGLKHLEA